MVPHGFNYYLIPILAQGVAILCCALYGLLHWRKAPRLALVGVCLIIIAALYFIHADFMQIQNMELGYKHQEFYGKLSVFFVMLIPTMILCIVSSIIKDSRARIFSWLFNKQCG